MKTIFIGSTPNLEKEDILQTMELLWSPLPVSDDEKHLQKEFSKYTDNKKVYFTNTGRTALDLILKTAGIGEGDEVITQSLSCMAASQPILWNKAVPIFADTEENGFNVNIEDVKSKVTKNTRAVIVQHLFGVPLDIRSEIDAINKSRERNEKIMLIEDCAHSLGAKYDDGSYVGTKGDFAYYSFSQDKVVSTVQGGCVVSNDHRYDESLEREYIKLPLLPKKEARYLLRYRLAWLDIKSLYAFPSIKTKYSLGKLLVLIYRKIGFIKTQVNISDPYQKELYRMSSPQKSMLRMQMSKLERYNKHRVSISSVYMNMLDDHFIPMKKGISYLRYPILVENPEEVRIALRNENVIIGNWYNHPIYPEGVNMKTFGYKRDCPNSETKARYIINLPTNIAVNETRAKKIVKIVNKYAKPIKF